MRRHDALGRVSARTQTRGSAAARSDSFGYNARSELTSATLVRTSTGTWSITYNGENRPIRFENAASQTVVECAYDSQGCRYSSGSRGKAKRSVAFPVSRRFFERAMKISKKVAACRAASGAVPARAGRGSGFSRSRR